MIMFFLYVTVASIFAAVLNRFWDYKETHMDPPKWVPVGAMALFWPATLPVAACYKLTNKVLDKITKV